MTALSSHRAETAGATALKVEPEAKVSPATALETLPWAEPRANAKAAAAEKRAEAKAPRATKAKPAANAATSRWCAMAPA